MDMDSIKKTMAENFYTTYAIRVQEPEFLLGRIDHVSKVWDDGFETDEELPGICGLEVDDRSIEKVMNMAKDYYGDHMALIAGDDVSYGQDDDEVIINDAQVLQIIK